VGIERRTERRRRARAARSGQEQEVHA